MLVQALIAKIRVNQKLLSISWAFCALITEQSLFFSNGILCPPLWQQGLNRLIQELHLRHFLWAASCDTAVGCVPLIAQVQHQQNTVVLLMVWLLCTTTHVEIFQLPNESLSGMGDPHTTHPEHSSMWQKLPLSCPTLLWVNPSSDLLTSSACKCDKGSSEAINIYVFLIT